MRISDWSSDVCSSDLGGSIIIDHVECIPLETQAKLVEFINNGEVQMIGGTIRQSVAVRIISTSTSPLDKLIEAGHFREDLFYALPRAQFILPSLSQRPGDAGPLTAPPLTRTRGRPGTTTLGRTSNPPRHPP